MKSLLFPSQSTEIDIVKRRIVGHYHKVTRISLTAISFPTESLSPSDQTFEREKKSFAELKETLLTDPNYLNKYVALVKGRVVDTDYDDSILAERVYKKFGYIPLFIGKITREDRVVELPSPE